MVHQFLKEIARVVLDVIPMVESILVMSPSTFELPERRTPLRKKFIAFSAFLGGLGAFILTPERYLGIGSPNVSRRTFLKRLAGSAAAGTAAGAFAGLGLDEVGNTGAELRHRQNNLS